MKEIFSLKTISTIEKNINDELLLQVQEDDNQNLQLSGLEFLAFLATKIAVPVITSFLSKALFEKYKDLQTKSQAEEAKKEISSTQTYEIVQESVVIEELTTIVISEGLSDDLARKIVKKTYAVVKKNYYSKIQ